MSYVLYVSDDEVIVIPTANEAELVQKYENEWGRDFQDYDRVVGDKTGNVISFRAKVN